MKILLTIVIAMLTICCNAKHNNDNDNNISNKVNKIAKTGYQEVSYPTPNYDKEKVNSVEGVILHHTAEPTAKRSLWVLSEGPRHVGTHVVIDTDGTRYIMCAPEVVTYHAGKSVLNDRDSCNNFTVGIEFQGDTTINPLTEDQIFSAIEYLTPIMKKYNMPSKNIVTHKMVRSAWNKKYPNKKTYDKPDITDSEYKRFMEYFNEYTDIK